MIIKWFGTASLAVETEKGSILFDPFIPLESSPVKLEPEDFSGYDTIFITHGHIDHISNISSFYSGQDIYCTLSPALALRKDGIPAEKIIVISPGDVITLKGFTVRVYKGRHIHFDRKLVKETLSSAEFRTMKKNRRYIEKKIVQCRESRETVAYGIEYEGKNIFLLGSMSLDAETEYPACPDVMILPYQGKSELLEPALSVIERLKPSLVLTDHFDNTFPPLSKDTHPQELKEALKEKVPVIIPAHKESVKL